MTDYDEIKRIAIRALTWSAICALHTADSATRVAPASVEYNVKDVEKKLMKIIEICEAQ